VFKEPSKFSFAVWEIESSTDIVLASSFADISVESDLQKPYFIFLSFSIHLVVVFKSLAYPYCVGWLPTILYFQEHPYFKSCVPHPSYSLSWMQNLPYFHVPVPGYVSFYWSPIQSKVNELVHQSYHTYCIKLYHWCIKTHLRFILTNMNLKDSLLTF